MFWFRLRPTFDIELPCSRETAIARIAAEHLRLGKPLRFLLFGEYGELHLPVSEHRLWSPHLAFYFHDHDGHCRLHGRFAPRVNVWTVVWIAYLAMIFTAFFGLILAVSQHMVDQYPWGYWLAIAAMLILGTIYMVAHLGQQWSADQMQMLRDQLDETLASAGIRNGQTGQAQSV